MLFRYVEGSPYLSHQESSFPGSKSNAQSIGSGTISRRARWNAPEALAPARGPADWKSALLTTQSSDIDRSPNVYREQFPTFIGGVGPGLRKSVAFESGDSADCVAALHSLADLREPRSSRQRLGLR